MIQSSFLTSQHGNDVVPPKKGGPPNRMNNLSYSDWMKFQKSFFRYSTTQALIEEFIYFFTKSVWNDGSPSRSLIIGANEFSPETIETPRVIQCKEIETPEDLVVNLSPVDGSFDFVLIDLRDFLRNKTALREFIRDSKQIFASLRQILSPQRYAALIVDQNDGNSFPVAWTIASLARGDLRLRDEKVGIRSDSDKLTYCLIVQSEDDLRPITSLDPRNLQVAKNVTKVPSWTIPKSPPRRKDEILHPAKYPESLVISFLELFTSVGDEVLDPMAGTGSTVIAAMKANRNAVGVELSPEFAAIANNRIDREKAPSLFEEVNQFRAVVVEGDATKLNEIPAVSSSSFDYVVTSPPYWSMLSNPGSENQKGRRDKNLKLVYSTNEKDLGNETDYDKFIELLVGVYETVANHLKDDGQITIVVKNVKRNHILYSLAWDLVEQLCKPQGSFEYIGNTLWCQDDIGLKPFAVGTHWVSNILHHYCLHFRKRPTTGRA